MCHVADAIFHSATEEGTHRSLEQSYVTLRQALITSETEEGFLHAATF